jgi:hypothetical protein
MEGGVAGDEGGGTKVDALVDGDLGGDVLRGCKDGHVKVLLAGVAGTARSYPIRYVTLGETELPSMVVAYTV